MLVHPLCPSRPVPSTSHTGVGSLCTFSPLARRLDRVAIYEEFLWLTQNGSRLRNFTLDRDSILVDGKASWSVGQEWGLSPPHMEPEGLGMRQHCTFSGWQEVAESQALPAIVEEEKNPTGSRRRLPSLR